MIWASDFPEVSIRQALIDFDEVVGPAEPVKRSNILGGNIARLLNLESHI
jgi:predicted TIM-barrel fold metal-dependent hydrolase